MYSVLRITGAWQWKEAELKECFSLLGGNILWVVSKTKTGKIKLFTIGDFDKKLVTELLKQAFVNRIIDHGTYIYCCDDGKEEKLDTIEISYPWYVRIVAFVLEIIMNATKKRES